MTNPMRVALIGAGGIGDLRAEAVTKTPALKLQVVVDIARERAEGVAQKYGAESSTDAMAVVQRNDVDMVIVSTPPNLHGEQAIAALNAKKHVIVEKPIAHSLEDAERMCDAADANGVFLKTGFNHRYFPSMAYAKKLIDSGKIGEVISVQSYAGHPGGKEFGHDWIHDAKVTGGGSYVDNGIHILDLARFFLGKEEMVTAKGYVANLIWPFENAEDNAYGLFRSASGKIAEVHSSWTQWRNYQFWVEVFCTRGYVRASYPPALVEWGEIPEPGIRAKRHWELFPVFQVQERLQGWRFTGVQSFVTEMSEFAAGIAAGRPTPATGRDGLRALQMAYAVYRSAKEGGEVTI